MLCQLVETVLAALGLPQLVQDSKGGRIREIVGFGWIPPKKCTKNALFMPVKWDSTPLLFALHRPEPNLDTDRQKIHWIGLFPSHNKRQKLRLRFVGLANCRGVHPRTIPFPSPVGLFRPVLRLPRHPNSQQPQPNNALRVFQLGRGQHKIGRPRSGGWGKKGLLCLGWADWRLCCWWMSNKTMGCPGWPFPERR